MSKSFLLLFVILSTQLFSQESDSDIYLLNELAKSLNVIEKVNYISKFEATESGKLYEEQVDTLYFDLNFSAEKTPKYFIRNSETELVYNGKSHIQLLKKPHLIVYNDNPSYNNPLLLSMYAIKRLIPKIINSNIVTIKRMDDIVLNGKSFFNIRFSFEGGHIDWDNFQIEKNERLNTNYELVIDKVTSLPRKMTMENGPTGIWSRSYEHLDFNFKIDTKVWTGQTFPRYYDHISFEDYYKSVLNDFKKNKNVNENSRIFEWGLPNLENNKLIQFKALKGNLLLLEFWFKNCGPCIKAIPDLNEITSDYGKIGLIVLGIEFYENFDQQNLQEYVKKVGIEYPVLYKAKKMASSFNIQSAPTLMLIDRKGEIVYLQSGFDRDEILRVIEEYK